MATIRGPILILIMILSSVPAWAMAQDASLVTILDQQSAVDQEHCRTEKLNSHFPCVAPYKRVAVIRPPLELARVFSEHVRRAFQAGYFQSLEYQDLFHGHMILHGPQTEYRSALELWGDVSAVLYHSAEYNSRWGQEAQRGVPVANRTPRSFVGSVDGQIQTALSIVGTPKYDRVYDQAGTIYLDEIVRAAPALSSHPVGNMGGYPKIKINLCHDGICELCEARMMIILLPEPQGRLVGPGNEKFDVTLRCVFAN